MPAWPYWTADSSGNLKCLTKTAPPKETFTSVSYTHLQVSGTPPAMQQPLIDSAVVYGLVFAAFSEFYDNEATEKILRLADMLAPELFKYWHTVPCLLYTSRCV